MRISVLLIFCLVAAHPVFAATTKSKIASGWQSAVPPYVNNSDLWDQLIPELMKRHMYYGALAAASDMINFFDDLKTKQLAYQTIVRLVDLGYPFSTRSYFIPGDIDPQPDSEFGQSYFLYKGIVNDGAGMKKWANYYFDKIDKDNFPKYLFYQAMQDYAGGHLNKAKASLKKMLVLVGDADGFDLAKKGARTLARIYYEQKKYDKSSEIYQTFLLKTNPINPDDWLEAAWSLYRLKQYNKAVGLLYNLQSKSAGHLIPLEKYILRALIYRKMCSYESTQELINTFNNEYGKTIEGIKFGEPLAHFPILEKVEGPDQIKYQQELKTMQKLKSEYASVERLPRKLQPVARYLYITTSHMLNHTEGIHKLQAIETSAKQLVILGESLKFLQFDVVRSKYNPDTVFQEKATSDSTLIDSNKDNFVLHWPQWGDYWRDERLSYEGTLKDQCD